MSYKPKVLVTADGGTGLSTPGTSGNILTSNGSIWTSAAPATSGTVTSVSGTTNRITSTGGNTPVIDISASYVGQSSITTLGTITTGTWTGSVVGLAYGGTNANLTASNGGIFYSTATAGAILSGTATAGQILRSGATAAPTWSTATYPATAGTSGNVLTSDGTNWTSAAAATGNVTGPGSSTDNAVVRFDGTTGKIIQNGVITEDDTGNLSQSAAVSGGSLSILTDNSSNTASATAFYQCQVAGSTASDAYFKANINGGQNWTWGLDNSDSDAFALSSNATLGTTNVMRIATTGETNYPLQTAFLAFLPSADNNVTGDGTAFTIGSATALTEIIDQNSDFNTNGTLTAPVTGAYLLCGQVYADGATTITASTSSLSIVTSNRSYLVHPAPGGGNVNYSAALSVLADMDAADTATLVITLNSSGGKTADVQGGGQVTVFSGKLEC